MVKRLNVLVSEEMYRSLRVKLAEDGENFSNWLRKHIEEYVGKKKIRTQKLRRGKEGK